MTLLHKGCVTSCSSAGLLFYNSQNRWKKNTLCFKVPWHVVDSTLKGTPRFEQRMLNSVKGIKTYGKYE